MRAYGGIQIGEEPIRFLPAAIKSGSLSLSVHHDPRIQLEAEVIDAFVRVDDDGAVSAVAVYEVEEEEGNSKGGQDLKALSLSFRVHLVGEKAASVAAIAGTGPDGHLESVNGT